MAAARTCSCNVNRVFPANPGRPEEEHARLLSGPEALAIFREVENSEITPYEDMQLSSTLVEKPLKGSPVVKILPLPEFNAVEWTLANNAQVIYRHADYEKDNIMINCISPGGTSLLPADMLASAMLLPQFAGRFGAGDFDATSLKKMLTGKNVSLSIGLTELNETISGSSAPKDFETLMQLLYLQF